MVEPSRIRVFDDPPAQVTGQSPRVDQLKKVDCFPLANPAEQASKSDRRRGGDGTHPLGSFHENPLELIGIVLAEVGALPALMPRQPRQTESGAFQTCLKCPNVGKVLLFACERIGVGDGGDDCLETPDAVLGHEIVTLHLLKMTRELRVRSARRCGVRPIRLGKCVRVHC
jgi:hypothetical protein